MLSFHIRMYEFASNERKHSWNRQVMINNVIRVKGEAAKSMTLGDLADDILRYLFSILSTA
jgi:hypothetical protein